MSKVIIQVTNQEREDILFALRLWLKRASNIMVGDSEAQLKCLIEKVDCAGSELPEVGKE